MILIRHIIFGVVKQSLTYLKVRSLNSSKSNEYEAMYNVQNRIYKGKFKIAVDKYSIALKDSGRLVTGNGILNKIFTRAQSRDHMGCFTLSTKYVEMRQIYKVSNMAICQSCNKPIKAWEVLRSKKMKALEW